jgi:hypothetical protein
VPAKKLARHYWITINRYDQFKVEELFDLVINSYQLIVKKLPKKIKRRLLKQLKHDIDSPWKDIIDLCFKEFLEFFYPHIAYYERWNTLETSDNPFTIIVMAH